jgi:ElaB/YqjD/DUF883 family membrane-anchored ribosome-binding protein
MSDTNFSSSSDRNRSFDSSMDKTAETLRPLLDQLMAGLHQAVNRLDDVASRAVDKVDQSGEYLKDAQERMAGGARGYVRDQPLTAVGVAVASGFLLSWLLRRR